MARVGEVVDGEDVEGFRDLSRSRFLLSPFTQRGLDFRSVACCNLLSP